MATFNVHLYKEFSTIVEVEAETLQEALNKYHQGEHDPYPDWEESGDEYASAIVGPDGKEHSLKDGEL